MFRSKSKWIYVLWRVEILGHLPTGIFGWGAALLFCWGKSLKLHMETESIGEFSLSLCVLPFMCQNSGYYSWACRQSFFSLQLHAHEANWLVPWKMTHQPRLCVKTSVNCDNNYLEEMTEQSSTVSFILLFFFWNVGWEVINTNHHFITTCLSLPHAWPWEVNLSLGCHMSLFLYLCSPLSWLQKQGQHERKEISLFSHLHSGKSLTTWTIWRQPSR